MCSGDIVLLWGNGANRRDWVIYLFLANIDNLKSK